MGGIYLHFFRGSPAWAVAYPCYKATTGTHYPWPVSIHIQITPPYPVSTAAWLVCIFCLCPLLSHIYSCQIYRIFNIASPPSHVSASTLISHIFAVIFHDNKHIPPPPCNYNIISANNQLFQVNHTKIYLRYCAPLSSICDIQEPCWLHLPCL